jgi:hypothetical protein
VKIGLTSALNQPVPQISRTAQTMIHGVSPRHISAVVTGSLLTFWAGMVPTESSRLLSAGESHSCLGCQILRKPIRQAIDTSEATTSTIQGLMKLETRNCGMAKLTPVTRMAGHTSFMPFQPAKAQISQNGTISEKIGSWRPTMAPKR